MSFPQRETVTVTTAADGSATVYSTPLQGKVASVQYVKNNFDDGVDFNITNEKSGETIWQESNVNSAAIKYPRAAVHDTAGTAATLDGTRAMRDQIPLAQDRVKIIIAQGGNAKSGTFHIVYE